MSSDRSAPPRPVAEASPAGLTARAGERTVVMGVLNVTPDSFSDGGAWLDPAAAVAHGRAMVAAGADLVDVGGESTRPGARRPDPATELARIEPVVAALAGAGVGVSIDTMRADVAAAAVRAGAVLVNDVSGGLADPALLPTVARLGVPVVLTHWRGPSALMATLAEYDDVVADVAAALADRVAAALSAGIDPGLVVVDPGLGFAKDAAHNWALLRGLDRLDALGLPLLVGASRKRFLGALLADPATGAGLGQRVAVGGVGVLEGEVGRVEFAPRDAAVGKPLDPVPLVLGVLQPDLGLVNRRHLVRVELALGDGFQPQPRQFGLQRPPRDLDFQLEISRVEFHQHRAGQHRVADVGADRAHPPVDLGGKE